MTLIDALPRNSGVGVRVRLVAVPVLALGLLGAAPPHAHARARPTALTAPRHAVRELRARRTPNATTWLTRSGQRITKVGLAPVRWRDDRGTWHKFDFALTARGSSLGPTPWRVDGRAVAARLPRDLAAGATTVTSGSDWIRTELLGATGSAKVSGTHARYAGALPGVDLDLAATPDGVKETLLLGNRDATSDFRYRLALSPGLRPRVDVRTGALVIARAGRDVFRLPAPTVVDATPAGYHAPTPRFALEQIAGNRWSLGFRVDRTWLARPERRFPVTVDPTTSVTTQAATTLECPWGGHDVTTTCNDPNVSSYQVGMGYSGNQQDILLRFASLAGPLATDDIVDAAHLKLYQTATSGNITDQGITATAIAANWTNQAPSGAEPPVSTSLSATGTSAPSAAVGWRDINVSDLVSDWQTHRTHPTEGLTDYGVRLSKPTGGAFNCIQAPCATPTSTSSIASVTNADATKRPYLEIVSTAFAPAGAAVVSPKEGQTTGRRVSLVAHAPNSSVTAMRYQYVAGTQRYWTDIPLTALKYADGTSPASTAIPVASAAGGGVDSKRLVWDLQATTGGNLDGSVHVRAILDGPAGANGATGPINFVLDRRDPRKEATATVGPGRVNLLTGDFTTTTTDVDVKAWMGDLVVSRTYHSRNVSTRDSELFGPHWAASFAADGGLMPYKGLYNHSQVDEQQVTKWVQQPTSYAFDISLDLGDEESGSNPLTIYGALTINEWTPVTDTVRWTYHYAEIELNDGSKITFRQTEDPDGNFTGWTPDETHPGATLTQSGTAWTLTDANGDKTGFGQDAADSPHYHPASFVKAGSAESPTMYWVVVNGRTRLVQVTAPMHGTTTFQQRWLRFQWTQDASTGNQPRVTMIYFGHDIGGGTVEDPVAQYQYDTQGRLVAEGDPRDAMGGFPVTAYTYDSGGHVATITDPGQTAWRLAYTTLTGDDNTGRLSTIKRAHPTLGDATWSVRYGVPLTGTGAPTQMTTARMTTWDEVDDLPTDATAISLPDHVPSSATDWASTTIHYLDVNGQEVNVMQPGTAAEGAGVSTAQYDVNGNVVMELTPMNRDRALASSTPQAKAQSLETVHHYDSKGIDELWTLGPSHQTTIPGVGVVAGRTKTTTAYDEGKPDTAVYHLPTSISVGTQYVNGSGVTTLADLHLTTYGYDQAEGSHPHRGWEVRKPTQEIVDPDGLHLVTSTVFDDTVPLVRETRRPAYSGSTGGHAVHFVYNGIDPGTDPRFMGTVDHSTTSVAVPEAPVPTTSFTYNEFFDVDRRDETTYRGSAVDWQRTTLYGYDVLRRKVSERRFIQQSGVTVSQDDVLRLTYDAQGNVATTTRSHNGSSTPIQTITSGYDGNGRLSSFTDAAGSTTTYAYNIDGDIATATDPNGSTTYTYNARELPVTVRDSTINATITGYYDNNGNLVQQSLPNGVIQNLSWNEADQPTDLTYVKSGCSANCIWVEDHVNYNGRGLWSSETTGTGKRSQVFTYDEAGRLTQVRDTAASGTCVTRAYTFDADSNRKTKKTYPAGTGGACSTTTTPVTESSTHDSADRLLTSGSNSFVYDGLGRVMSAGALLSTGRYYPDDRPSLLAKTGASEMYTEDPLSRTLTRQTGGVATPDTYHYDNQDDAPKWISNGTSWTRNVDGLDGQLIALRTTVSTYELTNLHGDVVGEASGDTAATAPLWTGGYDEFGIAQTPSSRLYGWEGKHERSQELPDGPVQMGARTYLPQIGRFLQVDPVQGGSANDYDYSDQDPVNGQDLGGQCPVCIVILGIEVAPEVAATIGAGVAIVAGAAVGNQVAAHGLPSFPPEMLGPVFSRGNKVSGAKGKVPNLNPAEEQALADKQLGKPYNKKALNSAKQKIKRGAKYSGTRHRGGD